MGRAGRVESWAVYWLYFGNEGRFSIHRCVMVSGEFTGSICCISNSLENLSGWFQPISVFFSDFHCIRTGDWMFGIDSRRCFNCFADNAHLFRNRIYQKIQFHRQRLVYLLFLSWRNDFPLPWCNKRKKIFSLVSRLSFMAICLYIRISVVKSAASPSSSTLHCISAISSLLSKMVTNADWIGS